MQTNYNEVAVLHQGAGKVTGARKFVKKVNIHMRDIEMSGNMKRLKRKMEVQKITFNYFAWPQPRNWNFFYAMMMMAIQKILLSGFKISCGYMGWPGWEWDFPAWNFVPVRPCLHPCHSKVVKASFTTRIHLLRLFTLWIEWKQRIRVARLTHKSIHCLRPSGILQNGATLKQRRQIVE